MDAGKQQNNPDSRQKISSASSADVSQKSTPALEPVNDYDWDDGWSYSRRIFIVLVGGIALAEILAMAVVYYYRHWPYYQQVVLDAVVMTAIILPLVYSLSFKPLLSHIRKRNQSERVTKARLRLMQYANTHSLGELLQFTLDEIEAMTGSTIGFFHFIGEDQKSVWLQAWSTSTIMHMCTAEGKGSHYDVEKAGVWADSVRELRPIIHNDYESLDFRKGLPVGHAPIIRELTVPVVRDKKVVAIIGVGNKPKDFNERDMELVSTLADFAWDIVQQKQADVALQKSEEKFRTLVDWTLDWEKWIDPDGNIIYTSPSSERITGYKPEEIVANPNLLFEMVHPDDRAVYQGHHKLLHDETAGIESLEYRIIARDGSEHWIEHVCRPLFDNNNTYRGRRVSNRDVTERKRIADEIAARDLREKTLNEIIHTMQIDIARDLHDTIGQNIGFLRMKLEDIYSRQPAESSFSQEIRGMSKVTEDSFDLIRGMLAVLQTETSADLFSMFSRYAEQVMERSPFEIQFSNVGEVQTLTPHQMRQLFYVFREALTNIEKYANAKHVSIELIWNENDLSFIVKDDGKGFDPSFVKHYDRHYGIKFMRERIIMLNGSFEVKTKPGAGTTIIAKIPYQITQPVVYAS
jgi:PAS domain S-box-containing protein